MNQTTIPKTGAFSINPDETLFRVWAPFAESISVLTNDRSYTLPSKEGSYFEAKIRGVRAGDTYRIQIDNGGAFPDPASRHQPDGVHGPSEVMASDDFEWSDTNWQGVGRESLVIYEIHVGTFTEAGTYLAAINRLDELIDLGITALEMMPVAQAAGRWNWGYDAVNLYAPSNNYGRPEELKALVDACHQKGLAVILDVVYNHIGPEGNYLANFGPYFSKKHGTRWGEAFNFDEDQAAGVRRYIRDNARYWIEEFHLDGLRLDAIRLMTDESEIPIIDEISRDVDQLRATTGRELHLIGETNVYDEGLLNIGYDAIWSDEVPHAILSVALDQDKIEDRRYLGFSDLEKCLNEGYLYRWSEGKIDRSGSDETAAHFGQIIHGLQTHDQVGNHPLGHRISAQSTLAVQRAAAALVLLYPSIPFVFMGEEFATPSPFCFFVDFGDDWLREAVIEGRKRDYEHHDWNDFVNPLDEDTFLRSKLPGREAGDEVTLHWYRDLLRLRKEWIEAGILSIDQLQVFVDRDRSMVTLRYGSAWVAVRLGSEDGAHDPIDLPGTPLYHSSGSVSSTSSLGMNEAAVGVG